MMRLRQSSGATGFFTVPHTLWVTPLTATSSTAVLGTL